MRADRRQRGGGIREPLTDLPRQLYGSGLRRQQLLQEMDIAAQIIQGDHGQAMSDECVVRVIPFGALCVEPDAAVDDQVAQLGQERHQQFLQQRRQVNGSF